MAQYSPQTGEVALHSRQSSNMRLHKGISYSLEEDGDNWNTPKLLQVVQTVYSDKVSHPLADLFAGKWDFEQPPDWQEWVRKWLQSEGAVTRLNQSQQHALQLPFQYALSLIQGPPGTGKTNLLGWILIALIRHAQTTSSKIRIAVSALTHQAIDQVLSKVVNRLLESRQTELRELNSQISEFETKRKLLQERYNSFVETSDPITAELKDALTRVGQYKKTIENFREKQKLIHTIDNLSHEKSRIAKNISSISDQIERKEQGNTLAVITKKNFRFNN